MAGRRGHGRQNRTRGCQPAAGSLIGAARPCRRLDVALRRRRRRASARQRPRGARAWFGPDRDLRANLRVPLDGRPDTTNTTARISSRGQTRVSRAAVAGTTSSGHTQCLTMRHWPARDAVARARWLASYATSAPSPAVRRTRTRTMRARATGDMERAVAGGASPSGGPSPPCRALPGSVLRTTCSAMALRRPHAVPMDLGLGTGRRGARRREVKAWSPRPNESEAPSRACGSDVRRWPPEPQLRRAQRRCGATARHPQQQPAVDFPPFGR